MKTKLFLLSLLFSVCFAPQGGYSGSGGSFSSGGFSSRSHSTNSRSNRHGDGNWGIPQWIGMSIGIIIFIYIGYQFCYHRYAANNADGYNINVINGNGKATRRRIGKLKEEYMQFSKTDLEWIVSTDYENGQAYRNLKWESGTYELKCVGLTYKDICELQLTIRKNEEALFYNHNFLTPVYPLTAFARLFFGFLNPSEIDMWFCGHIYKEVASSYSDFFSRHCFLEIIGSGKDKTGEFNLYGIIDENSQKSCIVQKYIIGTGDPKHNLGHYAYIRCIPNPETGIFKGFGYVNTREIEDICEISFTLKDNSMHAYV